MFKKLYKRMRFWIELKIKSRTGGIIAVPREFWPKESEMKLIKTKQMEDGSLLILEDLTVHVWETPEFSRKYPSND